jgi:hypothetical protein
MRSRARGVASVVAITLVAALSTTAAVADEPAEARTVTTAQLRWGLSNEANNRAFAPGTVNHFSAGRVADPAAGGSTLAPGGTTWSNGRQAGWKASSGTVTIEKFDGSAYRTATWEGLSTDSSGSPLGSPTAGSFSNHQIVFDRGVGTVDVDRGAASIRWAGDATVLFYSGMSLFYLSDPRLEVVEGIGTVRATLGGYGSSQTDPGAWTPLPPTDVVVADLGAVDLSLENGFTVTPKYLGIGVAGVDQQPGPYFGSFPQSFVDFQKAVGSAAFWHSSGGAADRFKPALPMTISYDTARLVVPPPPTPTPATRPDRVENPVRQPPAVRRAPSPRDAAPPARTPVAPPVAAAAPAVVDAPALVETPPPSTPAFQQVAQPTTVTAATSVSRRTPSDAAWWWSGIALLGLAVASVGATLAHTAAAARRHRS